MDKFGAGCTQPLAWHRPSPPEVAFGEELVAQQMGAPAQRLRQLSAAGEAPKEEVKALLQQVGAFVVLLSSEWGSVRSRSDCRVGCVMELAKELAGFFAPTYLRTRSWL